MDFNGRGIFILDGIGALLSAFLLGVVLVAFESTFGVPTRVLYPLAMIACVFAGLSFLTYALIKINWKPYLKAIAFANLSYCIVTIMVIFSLQGVITYLGWIYFAGEISLVVILVFFELQIAFARNEVKKRSA